MNFEKINSSKTFVETEKDADLEAQEHLQRSKILQWIHDRKLAVYLTGALSAASALDHEPVRAAEIPPGADFYRGVTALQEEAVNGPSEVAATFVIREGEKSGEWSHVKMGQKTNVVTKLNDVSDAVLNSLEKSGGRIKLRACMLHTHPVAGGIKVKYITQENADAIRAGKYTVSMPPSGTDISIFGKAKTKAFFGDNLKEKGVDVETFKGVIDPAGIIYHRLITDEDTAENFPEYHAEVQEKRRLIAQWRDAIENFLSSLDETFIDQMHALTKYKNKYDAGGFYANNYDSKTIRKWKESDIEIKLFIDSKEGDELTKLISVNPELAELQKKINVLNAANKKENDRFSKVLHTWVDASMSTEKDAAALRDSKAYKDLREVYARAGSMIRFVGHNEVEKEPPCAGVDYKQ